MITTPHPICANFSFNSCMNVVETSKCASAADSLLKRGAAAAKAVNVGSLVVKMIILPFCFYLTPQ